MNNPLVYPLLGLSIAERKRRFKESAFREVEKSKSLGLPTRIPFLKKVLCKTDPKFDISWNYTPTPCSSSFVLRTSLKPLIHPRESMAEVTRFNSAMHAEGLQLVPVSLNEGELARFEPRSCHTILEGDLKLTTVVDKDPKIAIFHDACYYDHIFQIFIREGIDRPLTKALTHEKEHALHMSLWGLAGFHHRLLPVSVREYLAMLASLVSTGDIAIIENSRVTFWKKINDKETRSYALASAAFLGKLLYVYGMKTYDVDLSVGAYYFPEKYGSYREQLEQVKKHGAIEYKKAYKALFGMDLEDLSEIVSAIDA